MNRMIRNSTENRRSVIITMWMDEYDQPDNLAATTQYIEHPKNIKKKRRISDKHLEYLNDIIATFEANIQVVGFPIIDKHPGGDSYSYYITFTPVTESGEPLMPIDLIFRIANHSSRSAEGSDASSFVRIKGFTLEHEDFDKASELIYEGIRILRELKKGNVDVLDEL